MEGGSVLLDVLAKNSGVTITSWAGALSWYKTQTSYSSSGVSNTHHVTFPLFPSNTASPLFNLVQDTTRTSSLW